MSDEVVVNTGESAASSATTRRRSNVGRSGPRASVACCDAQNAKSGTRCTACRTSDIECVLIKNDDRRKYGSRQHIASLQRRIHSVEALISDYQKGSQEQITRRSNRMPSEDLSDLSDQSDCDETSNTNQGMVGEGNSNEDVPRAQTPMSLQSGHAENMEGCAKEVINVAPCDQSSGSSTGMALGANMPQHALDHDVACLQDTAGFSVYLTPEMDDEVSSLDANSSSGQIHYYGPTTQLHIQSPSASKASSLPTTTFDPEFVVDMDSPQLRRVLLRSCWEYYSWSVQVVDEDLFTSHRKLGVRSQYYSDFLESCLLACATRISTSPGVRKLGRAYADRAKHEVVFELENPNLASIAGFLLLSDFEATNAQDRAGWIYCGIACRLLYDLGAHQDCTALVNQGILSQTDLKMRSLLFMSAFVYDKTWALYLGRPGCIPTGTMDVSSQPSIIATCDNKNLTCWVNLCTRISEVTECLNASGASLNRNRVEELLQVDNKIMNAYDLIPRDISSQHCRISELDQSAYGLNIQFHGIRIVLHRALIRIIKKQQPPISSDCLRMEKSRSIMHDNAVSICRLVLAYREIFGIENFITIMLDNMYIAASTIVSHILHPPSGYPNTLASDDMQLLRVLSKSMESAQKHYPVAEKMRSTLARITRNVELAGLFGQADSLIGFAGSSSTHPEQGSCLPQPGSWGSMEALLTDDVILGHTDMLLDGTSGDQDRNNTNWLGDTDLGLLR
ncbi:hypothetical protein PFICI_02349 [Pestalotiopsis fici W106-1]|uniref:Xylanolytic transcriptional activator regulatory domain-containing protein n=1 Tax=Pestalotiopsis fici (strain W106-1 / CGMCC3.15140) TaxID=1229662 RepID=W3XE89_PESFW|nr:uncharacterized protein PFICI_02349 [Pestalotiopsis fici W106-1]ETS84324.1 hypothetical protein PFICI_02349 [Pestalotiopsis fici W106-1]